MKQEDRLDFLLRKLIEESLQFQNVGIPANTQDRKMLLRALFNVRPASPVDSEFLRIQDAYLQEEIQSIGITRIEDISESYGNLYLWRGDITTLKAGAIVNAANSAMLGCFAPCHGCIDNAIHTFAGVQLRLACNDIMVRQGHPEETGTVKITKAFNLPSNYVLHTVGPMITNRLTQKDCDWLASCYRSCLEVAEQYQINSVAFCCISTGEYHFPNAKAAEIALQTVNQFYSETQSRMKVIFNVFKELDYDIYKRLLQANPAATASY